MSSWKLEWIWIASIALGFVLVALAVYARRERLKRGLQKFLRGRRAAQTEVRPALTRALRQRREATGKSLWSKKKWSSYPRFRRRPRPTRHPIVLAHGWLGFDRIGLPEFGHDYFRGVPWRLRALGHAVHVARVSPVASIRVRAGQLARQIEELGAKRVNIIAHSMGGLDARLAIARMGLGPQVASLTTIGTPHHGTPLADVAISVGEWRSLRRLLAALGADVDGLYDVSTERMREFNRVILDSPDVVYTSVIGAVNLNTAGIHALLSPAHAYLMRKAGPNDGIVPATSQLWGEAMGEVEADHWAQIGWFGDFDVETFYAQIAERLVERDL